MKENEITEKILKAAFTVHTASGPGLLESAYEECLYYELKQMGLIAEKQKLMPLIFKEVKMEIGYRVDLIVENAVIVEVKAVEIFNVVHLAQVLTYLKLSNCKLGLMLNFNTASLKNGIKRIIRTPQ